MYINVQNAGTAQEFSQKSKKGYWVILYYANWCPHCQMMKPEWQKFAEKHANDNRVNVAEVESQFLDQVGPEHKDRIQGYPTVMCAKNGKPLAGHEGPRTSNAFDEFANSNLVVEKKPGAKMYNLSSDEMKEININNILRQADKKEKKKSTKKSKKTSKGKKGSTKDKKDPKGKKGSTKGKGNKGSTKSKKPTPSRKNSKTGKKASKSNSN